MARKVACRSRHRQLEKRGACVEYLCLHCSKCWFLLSFLLRKIPEHRNSRQHHQRHHDCSDERMMQLVNECEIEQHSRGHDKQRRYYGISPSAVGTRRVRLTLAEDKDGAGGDHVKEPLGEDRQL